MKKWYQSKIMWVNIISVILEVLNLLMDNPIIPSKFAGVFTIVVNVLTMILRMITTTAIFGGGGNVCNGIKDTTSGLWLTSWNVATNTPTWGTEANALCLTDQDQANILGILNQGGGNNFIGARPRKPS